jgi:purine nucleoside phosphorylase
MGCDVVGQPLDPEATLAREGGCCYAALAVTIDDHEIRSHALPALVDLPACDQQAKLKQSINYDFYCRPRFLMEDPSGDGA